MHNKLRQQKQLGRRSGRRRAIVTPNVVDASHARARGKPVGAEGKGPFAACVTGLADRLAACLSTSAATRR